MKNLKIFIVLSLIAAILPGCGGVTTTGSGGGNASASAVSSETAASASAAPSETAAPASAAPSETAASASAAPAADTASASTGANSDVTSETASADANAAGGLGLLKPGVLQVGCEIGYPPFEYFGDDGTTQMGFDIDLGNAIAQEMGVQIVRIDTAWDGIFAGLAAKKYDCIISAVTINAERAQTMDFSTPYIENWQSIVIKSGNTPITSVKGLDGKKVAYQGSTTSDEYLNNLIKTGELSCQTFPYDKVLNCFSDLELGRVDAVLCDSTVADGYMSREPGKYEISWLQSSEPGAVAETFGVAVDKGNSVLLNAIDGALKKMKDSGKLDEIRKSWF